MFFLSKLFKKNTPVKESPVVPEVSVAQSNTLPDPELLQKSQFKNPKVVDQEDKTKIDVYNGNPFKKNGVRK